MSDFKSIKVSIQAYNAAIGIRDGNPDRYSATGLVGVFDDLLLKRMTTQGKGRYARKKDQNRS